jgi:hypothetical protein
VPPRDLAARPRRRRAALWLGWSACALASLAWAAAGCGGWDPRSPFEHDAPVVDKAIHALDAGDQPTAEQLLEGYLETGACSAAGIGVSDLVRQKANGSFDLGLTLFYMAEKFGRRFGDEEGGEGAPDAPVAPERKDETACALAIAQAIADDPHVAPDLRARAYFLAGNLLFMSRRYAEAIKMYDASLTITPGLEADAGVDAIGRDAAHNRAIALRRLDDQRDAGDGGDDQSDAGDSGQGDGGDAGDAGQGEEDASTDGGKGDAGGDGGDDQDPQQQNAGPDAGDGGNDAGPEGPPDAGGDAGRDAGPSSNDDRSDGGQQPEPQPGDDKQKGGSQDDRMLDRLEATPSYQQQEARQKANIAHRRRGMEDK